MTTQPIKTVTPIKVVTPVKPVQSTGDTVPVTVPLVKADVPNANNTVVPAEALKKSVTEISKEERLADVRNAVEQVQQSVSEVSSKEEVLEDKGVSKKTKNSSKNSNKGKRHETVSEIEANKEPVVREEPDVKEIEGYTINLLDYKGREDELRARLATIPGDKIAFSDFETDELKTVEMLWQEGKMLFEPKLGKYVIAVDIWNNGVYKIFLKDIIDITVNSYYDDVRLANPNKIGEYYQVYHKGKRTFDKINKKTFDYLNDNGLIPKINYCTIDTHTRLRFYGKKINEITDEIYQHEKDINTGKLNSRMSSKSFTDEAEEEGEEN